MAYRISAPLEKDFQLLQTDPAGETTVTIRQATRAAQDRRTDLTAEATRIWNDAEVGKIEVKQRISMADLQRLEVYMTLCGCNIEDADGGALFKFKNDGNGRPHLASENQFARAWGQLPDEVASEIHAKVLEVNPQWKPGGED